MAGALIAKVAASALTSKKGRESIGVIVGCLALLLFMMFGAVASLVSIFADSGKITSDFKAQETAIYKELRSIYDEYALDIQEEMEEKIEDCKKKHSYPYITPDNTVIMMCYADIIRDFEYINTAYTMAYLSVKNRNNYLSDKKNIRINKTEVTDFWNTIADIEVEEGLTSDNRPSFLFHNPVMTVDEIADYYFASESLKRQFKESVYLITQYIGVESFVDYITAIPNKFGIPLYHQYHKAWGLKPYGNGTISKNGCAPTCIAMVFTYLKGYTITPSDVVDYTGDRYYVKGEGSSWSIFKACANNWGVKCTEIGTSQRQVIQALEYGKPVILSMGPGIFTKSGHFIVLTGITEDGRVTVNDPNDNERKNFVNKEFMISQILNEAKGGWMFE